MVYKNGSTRRSTEDVMGQLAQVYGDHYDFSPAVYAGSKKPLLFICPIHGEVSRKAELVLAGRGCPDCGSAKGHSNKRLGREALIAQFKEIHGNLYDYSEIVATQRKDTMKLVCDIHGPFDIKVTDHLQHRGCQACGYVDGAKDRIGTTDEFLARAKTVHDTTYDYSKVEYTRYHDDVLITCLEHGDFTQTPNNHLQGKGCPTCGYSNPKAENEMCAFLDELGVRYDRNRRGVIKPFELDIYLPEYKLAIEHNGLYWHSTQIVDKAYHKRKRRLCKDKGIRLIQILEDEWVNRPEAVKSVIRAAIGGSDRIYARQTEIVECDVAEFLATNHHAGNGRTKQGYALTYKGEVVMAMTLRRWFEHRTLEVRGTMEIGRVAATHQVVGGLEKLIAHVTRKYVIDRLISFCDLRLFTGEGYKKAGFEWIRRSEPTGWYVRGMKRIHPRSFAAKRERDASKYNRLYDCGHDRYELRI